MAATTVWAMPSTTGPGLAPSAIPGPNTTTRPCDRSGTVTAAPYAASPTASSPCSLPCSVTKPSMTKPGLTPPTPSPHDTKYSLYKRWGVQSHRGRRLAPRKASRSEADVLGRLGLAGGLAAAVVEDALADADGGGGNLDQLIAVDPFDRLLDVQLPGLRQTHGDVGGRGAHVRQVLFLAGLHDHVGFLGLFPDDLAGIDLLGRPDEEDAAVSELVERVGRHVSPLLGDHRSRDPVGKGPAVGPVLVEEVVDQARPLGERQELQAEAEQAARRDRELQARAIRVLAEVLQFPLALSDCGDPRPREFLGAIDDELLVRLEQLPVLPAAEDDLRAAERELVPLAAHRLGEDRERQLPAAEHEEGVGLRGLLHPETDVPFELFLEPLQPVAGRDVFARQPRHRRVVHAELHGERRLVHADTGERRRGGKVQDRLADLDVRKSGDHADVAGGSVGHGHPLDPLEHVDLPRLPLLDDRAVGAHDRELRGFGEAAGVDAADREAPPIVGVVDVSCAPLGG